jgi:heme oxygenase
MVDILASLREQTRAEHDAAERELGLVDATLSLPRYRRRLEQFWGFYAPLEARLEACECAGPLDGLRARHRKSGWLAADLQALGLPRPDELPRCTSLPDLPGPAAMLGCSYVLEGATLGGQLIGRHVSARLGVSADRGGRFFHGYGDSTGAMWKAFTETVRSFVRTSGEETAIVAAALATFRSLRAWCGESGSAPSSAG